VADYRLYFMTEDGHIRHAIDLERQDDAHAIALVEARKERVPMELWQRSRQVRVFPLT